MAEDGVFKIVSADPLDEGVHLPLPSLAWRSLGAAPRPPANVAVAASFEEARRLAHRPEYNGVLMPGPALSPALMRELQVFASRTIATRFFEPRPLPFLRCALRRALGELGFANGDLATPDELADT